MIPNRNKPEQPGVGDFTVEHEHARRQVARALQVGGSTVIVAADQPGLTAYYVARILEQLSALERNLAPTIRKLPADRDSILQVLNERLANIDLANVADSSPGTKHRAREIWVYESLTSFNADGVCFGAKIIRQFQAAGISLLVSVTPGETNAAALKKLMHNCKAQRWDFAAPSQKQCDDAMTIAAGTSSFGAVQGVIRDMGMMANLQTPPEVLDFPKAAAYAEPSIDTDLDVRQLLKAQRKQNKSQRAQSVAATAQEPRKKRFVLAQLVAGIAFIGFIVTLQFDLLPMTVDTENPVLDSAPASITDADTPVVDVITVPTVVVETVSMDEPVVFAEALASGDGIEQPVAEAVTSIVPAVAEEAELMALFAEPERAPHASEALLTSEPVAALPPVKAEPKKALGVFVQHGSFAQLQGALVMQNNLPATLSTKVHVKGANPKRFVVLSGPFADRQMARDTLASGSDAFLVPAQAVGEEVMSLSGL
jgi:hypothetical protein